MTENKKIYIKYRKDKKIKYLIIVFLFFIIFSFQYNNIFASENSNKAKLTQGLDLTTFLYDREGNVIEELHGTEDRILVEYKDLPKNFVNAVIAIEDERFFNHHGIDIKRTLGAIITYLTNNGNSSFGGSTITQQLVKNITNDREGSISRKIREWIRAIKLERVMTKEEIFVAYVNTIYFGEGSYGVEVASKNYFGKSSKNLSIAESAILAATIQSPEATNPYKGEKYKNNLLTRQKIVLNKMLQLGFITNEEHTNALKEKIEFKKMQANTHIQSYFVDAVIEEAISDIMEKENVEYNIAKKMIYTNGYKIYTTLDSNIQKVVDDSYKNSKLFYPDKNGEQMQSAMVVLDHSNGNVLAICGGVVDKKENLSFNRATQSKRQPGSCMKPLGTYGPAFEKGIITPNSKVEDLPISIGTWNPQNYYNYYYGNVTVKSAIAKSMNTPAVRINQKIDKNFAFNFAKNIGLKSLLPSDKDIAPLSLGGLTEGVSPLEMANAYGTIANGGVFNEPKFYNKIVDKNGNDYISKTDASARVMRDSTAYMLTECLSAVVEPGGTAYGSVKVPNISVAGKTGNTDSDKDQWFCGFTPYYTIACWNGYDKPKTIDRPYPYYSVRMFNIVMNQISNGKDPKGFERPSSLVETEICKLSGLLPTEACRKDYRGSQVIKDYVDINVIGDRKCDVHEMVKICSITNLRASNSCRFTYMRPCIKKTDNYERDSYYMAPDAYCGGHITSLYNH